MLTQPSLSKLYTYYVGALTINTGHNYGNCDAITRPFSRKACWDSAADKNLIL